MKYGEGALEPLTTRYAKSAGGIMPGFAKQQTGTIHSSEWAVAVF